MVRIGVPTTLSTERNKKFRELYKKNFDIDVSIEEANSEFYRLGSFMAIIIENTPKYWSDKKN